MQKIVSNYAAAAHLALMAVAPLFLYPYASADATAVVLLWLSLAGAVWIVMAPSRISGESAHAARSRFVSEVLRDPLFWICLILVAFSGIRALNDGVAAVYDAETMKWSLSPPPAPLLPGCVKGEGFLPFAACVALLVAFMGARHALGGAATYTFFFCSSVLSGLAGLVSVFALMYGHEGVVGLAQASYRDPSFVGAAYGVSMLGGVVATFACVMEKWMRAEPLALFGMTGTGLGLVLFSPPATITVFALAFVLFAFTSFMIQHKMFEGSGFLRCALAVAISIVLPALYFMSFDDPSPIAAKQSLFASLKLFPEGFAESRKALSAIALKVWKAGPWLGSGAGSFPLDVRFNATPADWAVIGPVQAGVPNGWWRLLAERGVLGALMFALPLGFLAWTYFSGVVRSFGMFRWQPVHCLAPFTAAALVACAFVDASFMRADVLLAAGAALALSGDAFPGGQSA